ncbi:unnamed protein product [Nippostrongylus brasiliensis]|uniref:SYBU n=1 Tax=Nippostrongylus brasiliensis TaxID=27835 RepID=A0A0N4XVH6_NIPBR|nr:unnamed protein product [Nippostrongylus brasiliensis]
MQSSATVSIVSHLSEDASMGNRALLSSQLPRRESSGTNMSESPCPPSEMPGQQMREYTIEKDADKPLCERSSPVEEWSSDSRDSPLLEMSRYDNVPSSGSTSRRIRYKHSSSSSS